MIARLWHGWATIANADAYERLLRTEIIPGIAAKGVAGYKGIQVLRRPFGDGQIEFVTIMRFDSLAAVKEFGGNDYERAYVIPRARELLSRFDERSQHYEIRELLEY